MRPSGLLVIMRHHLFGIFCIEQWCQPRGAIGTHQRQCLRHPINHHFFSLGDLDNISNISSTGNNFHQGDVCQSTSHVFGGYGQVDNGVYRHYVRNESISYASPVQAQNFNMVQNPNFDHP